MEKVNIQGLGEIKKAPTADVDGRHAFISHESSQEAPEVEFRHMGASQVAFWETARREGEWPYLVKLKGQWRYAAYSLAEPIGYQYLISRDEVFNDDAAARLSVELKSFLRELDPDYFSSPEDFQII